MHTIEQSDLDYPKQVFWASERIEQIYLETSDISDEEKFLKVKDILRGIYEYGVNRANK